MRGSVDGFTSEVFHKKCDNKGATLTVIKANNRVFGGFTNLSWDSSDTEKRGDPNAFIFRVVNIQDENNSSIEKFNYKEEGVILCYKDYCAYFGGKDFGWTDIALRNNCNQRNDNYSNFGRSYKLPHGIKYESDAAKTHLCGTYKFTVQDYEVFQVLAP